MPDVEPLPSVGVLFFVPCSDSLTQIVANKVARIACDIDTHSFDIELDVELVQFETVIDKTRMSTNDKTLLL